jgi:hypothetical protein
MKYIVMFLCVGMIVACGTSRPKYPTVEMNCMRRCLDVEPVMGKEDYCGEIQCKSTKWANWKRCESACQGF